MPINLVKCRRVTLAAQLSAGFAFAVSASVAYGQSAAGSGANALLEEVTVTATKRSESLRSVAGSVTALTGEQLDTIGARNFKDYLNGLPGVQFHASTPGVSNVTLRGIGTATIYPDQGQATTGIYINDIPLTDPGFALSVPDLDVFDVQRVEVLRGPQGTLFGAASLGGAVNYVYNPVSLTELQASVQSSVFDTSNSSDLGYTAKGMINVPIVEDKLGIRLAAMTSDAPGYLDNIGSGNEGSNTHRVNSYRANLLWQINDKFSLRYFGFYDDARSGDNFYSFPALGELIRDTAVDETLEFNTTVNSITLKGDLGFAELSIQGADLEKSQDSVYWRYWLGPPPPLNTGASHASNDSQTYEVRLTSATESKWDWLVGVYAGSADQLYPSIDLVDGNVVGSFNADYFSDETALFGDLTYHFTDAISVTAGGRYYDIELTTRRTITAVGSPDDVVVGQQQEDGFSPKASIKYQPSDDFMTYGSVSTGFRMGGVNLNPPLAGFPTPETYDSDSLTNYEVGMRVGFQDNSVLLDSTVFYVDWSDIQLRLARPDRFAYVANAGSARSIGMENALRWLPSPNFSVEANVTYLSAELSESLDLGNGTVLEKGTTLPGASEWSTSESATYYFDSPSKPYVMVQHRYLSESTASFAPEPVAGNYNIFSIRAGATFGRIGVQAYVTNVGDERGIATASPFDPIVFLVEPRRIGISVDWAL
jgi:iron complex outermembrane recepter protein